MTNDPVTPVIMICDTCRNALDLIVNDDGASYEHTVTRPADHPVVPVPAPAGWKGDCDFCTSGKPAFVLPARDFRVPGDDHANSVGDWAACANCADLIGANDWNGLINRIAANFTIRHGVTIGMEARTHLRSLYTRLRKNATGPIRPLNEQGR